MKIRIKNASNLDFKQFLPLLKSFLPFATKNMGFDQAPNLVFASDSENAQLPLGKTAHYEPETAKITIFTDKRHPKDVLRSLSHELVHHKQNCGGEFSDFSIAGEGYTQDDPHLRGLEEEAYSLGNMTFRDWEDTHKKQLQESTYYNQPNLAGDTKMNTKQWKDLEINNLLMERWGYKTPVNEDIEHLCAMRVAEVSTGRVGHPINHTLLEDGTVTHYDVEFGKVIVEGMPVKALEVLENVEHSHPARREDDDYEHDENKPREKYMGEELEEQGLTGDELRQALNTHIEDFGAAPSPGVQYYKVKEGDNLSTILQNMGADDAMEASARVAARNDIKDMNVIQPGQVIAVGDSDLLSGGGWDENPGFAPIKEEDMDLPDIEPEIQSAMNTNVDTSIPNDFEMGEPADDIEADITTASLSEDQLRGAIREALIKAFNR